MNVTALSAHIELRVCTVAAQASSTLLHAAAACSVGGKILATRPLMPPVIPSVGSDVDSHKPPLQHGRTDGRTDGWTCSQFVSRRFIVNGW
jgi:hypothetical protein